MDFDLRAPDTLKSIVGDILPGPLGSLGVGKGSLSLKGDEGRVAVDLDAGFTGTRVALKGAIVAPTAAPAIDLVMSVANDSTADLIKQFALPLDIPGAKDDGPVRVATTVRGRVNELNLRTTVDVGGGNYRSMARPRIFSQRPVTNLRSI